MSILEVGKEHNISEVSFHRWNRQFGQMDLNETRKLKELERENGELKKILAEARLENRVLEAVAEKMVSPVHRRQAARAVVPRGLRSGRAAFRHHYNHSRPHSKFGYVDPARDAAQNPHLATLTDAGQNNQPTLRTRHASG